MVNLSHLYFAAPPLVGVQNIAVSVPVCVFVCPLVCLDNCMSKLHKICCTVYILTVAMAQSFYDNSAVHCILLVLWIMPCFYIVAHIHAALAVLTWMPCCTKYT